MQEVKSISYDENTIVVSENGVNTKLKFKANDGLGLICDGCFFDNEEADCSFVPCSGEGFRELPARKDKIEGVFIKMED